MPARGTGRSVDEEFFEIVYGDEELLAAEFDAIIAANWPAAPAGPTSGASRPVRGRSPSGGRVVRRRGDLSDSGRAGARERSPPREP
jgi:hypothetical protein